MPRTFSISARAISAIVIFGSLSVVTASADVFNMPAGQTSLGLVAVGNAGNPDDSVTGYGGVPYNYGMGKFEVTAGQYTAFLNAVGKTDTNHLYQLSMDTTSGCKITRTGALGSYSYSVASDWANRPVNVVSWLSAARFVNWLTNGQPSGTQNSTTTEDGSYLMLTDLSQQLAITRRPNAHYVIPTEDEWYKAAYHKNDGVSANYWIYPTGTNNTPSPQLIDPDPGNNANFSSSTIGLPYLRTPVGEFENSESPYGTFDQGGNVAELNEDPVSGFARVLRGGYWDSDSSSLQRTQRYGRSPGDAYYDFGFRIAEVPEPATGLLLLAGLPLIYRRRLCWRSPPRL